MRKQRPFRFGVSVHGSKSRAEWIDVARRSEELGYSTLLIPDHLGDQFSPIPALVTAADATSTLRVGSLVFDNEVEFINEEVANYYKAEPIMFTKWRYRQKRNQRFSEQKNRGVVHHLVDYGCFVVDPRWRMSRIC